MRELNIKQLRAFLIIQLACLSCVLVLLIIEERLAQVYDLATNLAYNILLLILSVSLIMLSNKRQFMRQWLISLNLLGIVFTLLLLFFLFQYA